MEKGIQKNEYHPAADLALDYINSQSPEMMMMWCEVMSERAFLGNKLAVRCWDTLKSISLKKQISDKDLLGLVWVMKKWEDDWETI